MSSDACYTHLAMENFYEEIKVKSKDLVEKVKSILHEGNVTGRDGEFSPAMFRLTLARSS